MDKGRYTKGLHDLGRGCWAWLQPDGGWGWSNAGLVCDGGESLLVDTLFDLRLTAEMLAAMRASIPAAARIGALVNTHANGDHCYGNQLVADARIIASRASAAEMDELPPEAMARFMENGRAMGPGGAFLAKIFAPFEFKGIRHTPPTETFDKELRLRVGGKEVVLIEVGPAHTPGDLIVWIPDARVVLAADILFIGVTPIMWAGPVERWIAALERLLDLGAERFLPGHGPVCGPDEVRRLADYWRWLDGAARRRLAAGSSPTEAAREIVLGDEIADLGFADWLAPERTLVNVGTIDAHRRGVAGPRSPRDLVGAFFGMALLARDRDARR